MNERQVEEHFFLGSGVRRTRFVSLGPCLSHLITPRLKSHVCKMELMI